MADDASTLEYYRRLSPEGRQQATAEPTKTTAQATPPPPPGEWLVDPSLGPAADYVRKGLIAANQFGVGVAGDAATAGRGAWNLGRLAYPSIGEPPEIFYPQGPGGYINTLTPAGLTPYTPTERVIGAAAQGAGSAFPFEGPVGMGINALAGGTAQAVRESGGSEGLAEGINMAGAALTAPGAFSRQAVPWRAAGALGLVPQAAAPVLSRGGAIAGAAAGAAAGGAAAVNPYTRGIETGIWSNVAGENLSRYISDQYGIVPGVLASAGIAGLGYYMGSRGLGLAGSGGVWSGLSRVASKLAGGAYMANTMSGQGYPQPAMGYSAPNTFMPPQQ